MQSFESQMQVLPVKSRYLVHIFEEYCMFVP